MISFFCMFGWVSVSVYNSQKRDFGWSITLIKPASLYLNKIHCFFNMNLIAKL